MKTGTPGPASHDLLDAARVRGASFARALAELVAIDSLHALDRGPDGTTMSIGVVRGGTCSNVVPDHAVLDVDVRVPTDTALGRGGGGP